MLDHGASAGPVAVTLEDDEDMRVFEASGGFEAYCLKVSGVLLHLRRR